MSKLIQSISLPKATVAAIAAAAMFSAGVAGAAGTANTTFQVTATILTSCTVSGSALNFGSSIDPIAAAVPLDATSTLNVQCSNTTPYTVALNAGTNAGGAANFTARAIKNGSNTLGYQLYTDSGRTSVWGNGTASTVMASGTGNGSTQPISIYGRLPSLSGAVPGTYTDTVTVTVTY